MYLTCGTCKGFIFLRTNGHFFSGKNHNTEEGAGDREQSSPTQAIRPRKMMPRNSMIASRTANAPTPAKKAPVPASQASSKQPLMIVAVRVRPLSSKETCGGHKAVVGAESDTVASIARLERSGAVLQSEKGQMHAYEFDRVFGEESTNEQVYVETAQELVPKVLEGVNCTIFAYGATGAGKTHTIMGNDSDPGMMPRSMIDLFATIQASEKPETYTVKVSYMEVYCETIRDLLSDSEKALNPCEHATDGTVRVLGLTEREVNDVDEVLELVREGSGRRKTEPTAANEFSSRSHAVLQVTVQQTLPHTNAKPLTISVLPSRGVLTRRQAHRVTLQQTAEPQIRQGRLSLIDLAGSERAAATLNRGTRLREGANINKSLLALANCINALSSGSERVKYRDSKLTHLLKSSLEGDCHVAMLAAVNPSHKSYEESHNTLKYAHRAKSIKANAAPTIIRRSLSPVKPPVEIVSKALPTIDENSHAQQANVQAQPVRRERMSTMHNMQPVTSISNTPKKQSENENQNGDASKLEQMLKAVRFERDQLLEERDELKSERDNLKIELQKAKELLSTLTEMKATAIASRTASNLASSSRTTGSTVSRTTRAATVTSRTVPCSTTASTTVPKRSTRVRKQVMVDSQ